MAALIFLFLLLPSVTWAVPDWCDPKIAMIREEVRRPRDDFLVKQESLLAEVRRLKGKIAVTPADRETLAHKMKDLVAYGNRMIRSRPDNAIRTWVWELHKKEATELAQGDPWPMIVSFRDVATLTFGIKNYRLKQSDQAGLEFAESLVSHLFESFVLREYSRRFLVPKIKDLPTVNPDHANGELARVEEWYQVAFPP
jgi:hypothetical protein